MRTDVAGADRAAGQAESFRKGGFEYISGEIEKALRDGTRKVTVTGNWEIDRAVGLPSDFSLTLSDCHLRMADGCFSNMFTNEHCYTTEGRRPEGADRKITIEGAGRAILDGGEYNGLSERNELKDGMPPIWKNNLLLFSNVDGFRISGIECRNMRWWALNFLYCRNGYLGSISFCANDTGIGPDGIPYRGLKRAKYEEVLVKNADGIDLRQGCRDIVIENITGFTEDDTLALTALDGLLERTFRVEGLPSDICNVRIRNVRAAAYCSIVRLLNQGDIKLHDIEIDGVCDMSEGSPHMDRGIYAVRIGDTHMYGPRHATEDETYGITVKNIRGRGDYVLGLCGAVGDLALENIEAAPGTKLIRDQR